MSRSALATVQEAVVDCVGLTCTCISSRFAYVSLSCKTNEGCKRPIVTGAQLNPKRAHSVRGLLQSIHSSELTFRSVLEQITRWFEMG